MSEVLGRGGWNSLCCTLHIFFFWVTGCLTSLCFSVSPSGINEDYLSILDSSTACIAEVPECLTVLDAFDLPTVQDVGELPLIPFSRILKKVCGRAHFPGQCLLWDMFPFGCPYITPKKVEDLDSNTGFLWYYPLGWTCPLGSWLGWPWTCCLSYQRQALLTV